MLLRSSHHAELKKIVAPHYVVGSLDVHATTFFKNSTIDARNAEIQKFADNETVFYIDCNPVFDDDTGALTPEYSGDGVHVKAPYYAMWRDYLFQFGVVR